MGEGSTEKCLRLRYDEVCRRCGRAMAVDTQAIYERLTRTVRCLSCTDPSALRDAGPRA